MGPGRVVWPTEERLVEGKWEIAGIEQWLEVLPSIRGRLQRSGVAVAGGCRGSMSLRGEQGNGWSVAAETELTGLRLAVAEPYRVDQLSGEVALEAEVHVGELGASIQFEANGNDTGFLLSKGEGGRAAGWADVLAARGSFVWAKSRGAELGMWGKVNLRKNPNAWNWLRQGTMGAGEPMVVEVRELGMRAGGSSL